MPKAFSCLSADTTTTIFHFLLDNNCFWKLYSEFYHKISDNNYFCGFCLPSDIDHICDLPTYNNIIYIAQNKFKFFFFLFSNSFPVEILQSYNGIKNIFPSEFKHHSFCCVGNEWANTKINETQSELHFSFPIDKMHFVCFTFECKKTTTEQIPFYISNLVVFL